MLHPTATIAFRATPAGQMWFRTGLAALCVTATLAAVTRDVFKQQIAACVSPTTATAAGPLLDMLHMRQ